MEMLLADTCTTMTVPSFAQLLLLLFINFKLTFLIAKKLTLIEQDLLVGNIIDGAVTIR